MRLQIYVQELHCAPATAMESTRTGIGGSTMRLREAVMTMVGREQATLPVLIEAQHRDLLRSPLDYSSAKCAA